MQVASGGEGRFFRAAAVDLEAFDALSALRPQEILDTPSFASRLSSPAPEDSVAQFLGDQLSAAALDALFSYPGLPDSELLAVLVPELNRILAAGPIYEAGRFAGVRLFPSTLALLASGPRGADLFRLNRWLLA